MKNKIKIKNKLIKDDRVFIIIILFIYLLL